MVSSAIIYTCLNEGSFGFTNMRDLSLDIHIRNRQRVKNFPETNLSLGIDNPIYPQNDYSFLFEIKHGTSAPGIPFLLTSDQINMCVIIARTRCSAGSARRVISCFAFHSPNLALA